MYDARVARTLTAAASALDNAIYSMNGSLIGGRVHVHRVPRLALAVHSRDVGRGPTELAFTFLEGRTRLYGEVTQTMRAMLQRRWGLRSTVEMERLLAGGMPFAAFAIGCEPTSVNTAVVDTRN